MAPLDKDKKENIETTPKHDHHTDVLQQTSQSQKIKNSPSDLANAEGFSAIDDLSIEDVPKLYNDVEIDASHIENDIVPLDFQVEEMVDDAILNVESEPFSVDKAPDLSGAKADIANTAIYADQKNSELRQEPVMLEKSEKGSTVAFSATEDPEIGAEEVDEEPMVAAPPIAEKPVRGSKLGMGWFQGFNLFICGLIFIGLAIFAYFMFGEEPLYTGKVPKYVVIANEDSGSMAALNPALTDAEREKYVYVPKVEVQREDPLEQPVLDPVEKTRTVTKVELLSNDSGEEETISTETVVSDVADDEVAGLSLHSLDHDEEGLSQADILLIDGLIQMANNAFFQGNYVGINQDDAYYFYQEVLTIDADNAKGQQGILAIADVYYRSALDAYRRGDLEIAQQYLAIGQKVQPNYAPLSQLETQMQQQPYVAPQNNSNGMSGFQFE